MVVVASEVELQAVVVYEKKDDESRDSSIADGRRVGILGSQRTGKIITVALSTPIEK